MTTVGHSVCPHDCPSACALDVEVLSETRIGRVRGAAQPYTDGVVCAKVARYAERAHHPDRLTTPLRRVGAKGDGRFEPIGWDEALDRVAEAFANAPGGPQAVWPYHYAGTMGLVQRDGIERLKNVLGYSAMGATFCVAIANAGWKAGVGGKWGVDSREMAESEVIVVWGANPVHTQVHAMSWIRRAQRDHGAKLVVVDSYRTATAEHADVHLAPRPGTDAALACAVMHVLFAEGLADRDYLRRRTDFPADLEAHLAARGPAWAEGITGVPAEHIVAFARLYGSTKRSFLRAGFGFTRHRNGAAAMHAITCLPAVTGAWEVRGGGALFSQGSPVYGLDASLITGEDVGDPSVRTLDMARIGAVLTGDAEDLAGGPPIAAMLIQNVNPATTAPESARVRQGLLREDLFVCVHEQFMTDTARLADIVLPATMFTEHDDLYVGSAHAYLQASRALVTPPGECRSNHEVICALGKRLGARHPGFDLTAWELIDATLRRSGKPGADELLEQRWLDCTPPYRTAHFLDGFPQPEGRFRFAPDWAAFGDARGVMPRLPDHLDYGDFATPDKPFRLVAAPSRNFLNTSFSETEGSQRGERGRPTVQVHPATCAKLGLKEGDLVRLGNERGSVLLPVRSVEGSWENTVVVEGIWPNHAFIEGNGINTLVGSEPALPARGAAFHDTAVWMRRAEPLAQSHSPTPLA